MRAFLSTTTDTVFPNVKMSEYQETLSPTDLGVMDSKGEGASYMKPVLLRTRDQQEINAN
jgi:hypothetical protein